MSSVTLGMGDALIAVDVQNDFLPGGSLGVPEGDAVLPVLNGYVAYFVEKGLPVYATRDWHPADHCSFRERGGRWPSHCVAGSPGAEFAASLRLPQRTLVISKATKPDEEAYSGFQGTELDTRLRASGIERLFVGGLATDYCVLHTVMDALDRDYQVFLLVDAVRAVDVNPDDGRNAEEEMKRSGARALTLARLSS